jgi:hypothetical protein
MELFDQELHICLPALEHRHSNQASSAYPNLRASVLLAIGKKVR